MGTEATIERIIRNSRKAWRPPKRIHLSDWADDYFYLSAESAAQEGRWYTLSYQRGIMNAMTDPSIEKVVVMKSARVGYTKMVNALIGYHMHQDPCPIMVVQPTDSDAEGYSKEEIAPMLRDVEVLRGLCGDEKKSKDPGNTILHKKFPGGVLQIVGANSPRGFRRVSRRVVIFDETDGYPASAGEEGDQIKLGSRRAEYYWNRKIALGSTPLIKGSSRIENEFLQTDQRRFFVPCPCCGHYQYLRWSNMKWPEGEPAKAYYVCEANECVITHDQKSDMLDKGEWRATAEGKSNVAGFHIWAAYSYSPNASWGQLAQEFLDAKGDPLKLKTFINTVLGETWEEQGQRVDENELLDRAITEGGDWRKELPEGVLLISCGVDVQPDRLECEVVGWGLGEESWSLNYRVFMGDPNSSMVWQQLDLFLMTEYQHPSGVRLRSARTFIDSGGSNTIAVYDYVRDREFMQIYAIKGIGKDGSPAVGNPTKNNIGKIPLFPLGTFALKDMVHGRLRIREQGAGYCHFPKHYNIGYYEQLTAEEVRTKYSKGFPVREWHKKSERRRNEAFDCRNYATAAMMSLNVNFDTLAQMFAGTYQYDVEERQVRAEMQVEGSV